MKKTKSNTSIRKYLYLGLGLAALVGVILFVKNKLMVSPQIAQITDQYCQSNVTKFEVSDECTHGTFKGYSFTCKNGMTLERPGSGACYEYFSAYQDAQKTCGVTCTTPQPTTSSTTRPSQSPYPSPSAPTRPFPSPSVAASPSAICTKDAFTCKDGTVVGRTGPKCEFVCPTMTPTPSPTTIPEPPQVSCTTEVYKLPAKFNSTAVSSEILAKHKVSGRNLVARPGDRFAFNLNLTSKTKRVVTDARFDFTSWTTTTLGEAAPFTIVQAGESCQIYPDKSVRCGIARLNSPDKRQSLRPNTYMVVSFDDVDRPTKTDLTYNTLYAGENVACSTVNINVLPKPVRRCYGYGKMQWCRYVDAQ